MASSPHTKAMSGAPSLRLLCSITGGTLLAQWEDITVPTPLSKVKDCVSFTTTVSARFWLIDCPNVHDSTDLARQLYYEASLVPYMGKFVVFSKRLDADEALIRCFCVTDDKVDKTLECQEGFEVCAASPEVEVIEGRAAWLETAGNLLPVTKSGDQLNLHFTAFRENRLAFPVRMKDLQAEQAGKLAFMREPRNAVHAGVTESAGLSPEAAALHKPICTLEVNLGACLGTKDAQSTDLGLLSLSEQLTPSVGASLHSIPCVFPKVHLDEEGADGQELMRSDSRLANLYAADVIARSQLDLLLVATEVGADWPRLAGALIPESGLGPGSTVEQLVDWIARNEPNWPHTGDAGGGGGSLAGLTVNDIRTSRDQALAVLLAWREHRGDAATGNELDRALREIGRMDVIKSCMRDIQCVTDENEHAEATRRIDHGGVEPPSDATATSIVGTGTLMSGMEELSALHMGEMHETKEMPQPTEELVPEPEEFVPPQSEIVVDHPTDAVVDESLQPTDEVVADVLVPESDEPLAQEPCPADDNADQYISELPPASTTSQQDGDPLLAQVRNELIPQEDADIVKESESMATSLEEKADDLSAVSRASDEVIVHDSDLQAEELAGTGQYGDLDDSATHDHPESTQVEPLAADPVLADSAVPADSVLLGDEPQDNGESVPSTEPLESAPVNTGDETAELTHEASIDQSPQVETTQSEEQSPDTAQDAVLDAVEQPTE